MGLDDGSPGAFCGNFILAGLGQALVQAVLCYPGKGGTAIALLVVAILPPKNPPLSPVVSPQFRYPQGGVETVFIQIGGGDIHFYHQVGGRVGGKVKPATSDLGLMVNVVGEIGWRGWGAGPGESVGRFARLARGG